MCMYVCVCVYVCVYVYVYVIVSVCARARVFAQRDRAAAAGDHQCTEGDVCV